ncbi:NAD-dependent epimerase/dehydratase family protein [[Eubacterium] cellulosolvens]
MTILITGGLGLVGHNLAHEFVEKTNEELVLLDIAPKKIESLERYSSRIRFEYGDITDLSRLFEIAKNYDVRSVIHTAAVLGFKRVNDNPYTSYRVNVEGTLNVLELARILDLDKVIYASSGAVYGDAQAPVLEDTPVNPSDIYGAQKAAGESIGLQYSETYKIDFISVRLYFIYGPGLILNVLKKMFEPPIWPVDVLYTLTHHTITGIPFRSEVGGDTELDYTFVGDTVNGIRLAYMKKNPRYRVYNISSGKAYKLTEIAEVLNKLGGRISFGPGKLKHWPRRGSFLDISRARQELGYTPEYGIEKGLRAYHRWLKKRHEPR